MTSQINANRQISGPLLQRIMWAASNSLEMMPDNKRARKYFSLRLGLRKSMMTILNGKFSWDDVTREKVRSFSDRVDHNLSGILKLMERIGTQSLWLYGYEKSRIQKLVKKLQSRVIRGRLPSAYLKIHRGSHEYTFSISKDGTIYAKAEDGGWDILKCE